MRTLEASEKHPRSSLSVDKISLQLTSHLPALQTSGDLKKGQVMAIYQKFWRGMAGLNGFLAVVMGAIAAHAIAGAQAAAMADKASLYQLIHAAVLLGLADKNGKRVAIARWMFLFGIIFFCGSLDLRAVLGWDDITKVAPLGGISFMFGWLLIIFSLPKEK